MKVKSSIAKSLCESFGVNRITIQGEPLFGEPEGFHIYTIDGYYEHLTCDEYFNLNKTV